MQGFALHLFLSMKLSNPWRGLLKTLLVLLLSWVLYIQLLQNQQMTLPQWWQGVQSHGSWATIPLLFFVLLLVGLNWGLETQKWRWLMLPIEPLPFGRALRAVLAGVTFSLFTPNRVGEYGGRVLLVGEGHRIGAVWATLTGSLAQWWVLWAGGILALAVFVGNDGGALSPENRSAALYFLILGIAIGIFLGSLYFGMGWWLRRAAQWRWTHRWAGYLWKQIVRYYTRRELLGVLLYSACRYAVYSFQYFLLLRFWGCSIPFPDAALAIAFIFFLQTGIPIPPATGLVMRGNIAIWVFSFFPHAGSDWSLLAAAWSLWLVNVIFPGVIGGWVLLRLRK